MRCHSITHTHFRQVAENLSGVPMPSRIFATLTGTGTREAGETLQIGRWSHPAVLLFRFSLSAEGQGITHSLRFLWRGPPTAARFYEVGLEAAAPSRPLGCTRMNVCDHGRTRARLRPIFTQLEEQPRLRRPALPSTNSRNGRTEIIAE